MINIVMGTAIYNHYKAGHGYKGAQAASKFSFKCIKLTRSVKLNS